VHQPLSKSLAAILEEHASPMTLNRLIERTQGRGLYLVVILLCVPFIIPVSLPGLSTIMGTIIGLLMLRIAVGKSPRLPRFLGEKKLPSGLEHRALNGSVKFLRWIEKFVRPRQTRWLQWPASRFANSLLVVFMAFLLALPIPPIILFTNSFPSYAIILIAVSMMEEDGVTIWFGYAMALFTVAFFGFIGDVVAIHLITLSKNLIHLLQNAR
jgi:hypothetical protein